MKKTLILVILFSFVISLTTCSDDSDDKKIIPSEKFVLPEGCRWVYMFGPEKLYRIDNIDELKKIIECGDDIDIDFENKTLLVASVGTGVYRDVTNKLYVSENDETKYNFDVTINYYGRDVNITAIYLNCHVAILVNKIDPSIAVDLNFISNTPRYDDPE